MSAIFATVPSIDPFESLLPTASDPAEEPDDLPAPSPAFGVLLPKRGATRPADLEALIAAIGRGDRGAFRALYEVSASQLFGVAVRITRSGALAEDVLQDAFVSVWNNAHRYDRSLAAPLTWLASIVRHRALDVVRQLKRTPVVADYAMNDGENATDSMADDAPLPEDRLSADRENQRVNDLLRGLPVQQRQAITLAYFGDLTHTEVSAAMGVPVGTVKSWVRRGLLELRKGLAGEPALQL